MTAELDRIIRDADGRVRFHYVLIDFLCRVTGGELQAGSDVSAVELADREQVQRRREQTEP